MTFTFRSMFLPLAVFGVAAAMVTYSARQFTQAKHQHDAAIASFRTAHSDSREVLRLRGMAQRINDRPRPEQDMIARLHAAMQQAGLDVSRHFQSLRLEGDVEVPGAGTPEMGTPRTGAGAGVRRQSVAVALSDLNLPQLGALLMQWRRDQPLWDITRLEMAHARGNSQSPEADRYDVALSFSAIYASQEDTP